MIHCRGTAFLRYRKRMVDETAIRMPKGTAARQVTRGFVGDIGAEPAGGSHRDRKTHESATADDHKDGEQQHDAKKSNTHKKVSRGAPMSGAPNVCRCEGRSIGMSSGRRRNQRERPERQRRWDYPVSATMKR